jgi:hypothetical protein
VAAAGAAIGAGLPSLPAPSAVTAQSSAAELIDLGARFEPLLDRYYVAHRRWSVPCHKLTRSMTENLARPPSETMSIRRRSRGVRR